MRTIALLAACASLAPGCFGQTPPPLNDDAGYGRAPDLAQMCVGNNDGVLERWELQFPLGATVKYLENPTGTTVPVNPDGTPGADGPEWDLTSTAGDVVPFVIEPMAGKWYASSFPTATYATFADPQSHTLAVFRVEDAALLLLGFASETQGQTLLVYDQPIATLRFPAKMGDAWVTGAKITNGTLAGMPFASTDTYKISIDARGVAVLPFLRFTNTLKVHIDLTQALPGGVSVHRIQYLFFHECVGELGRMVSNAGEQNPSFSTAGELRRLAL
jgi:hypothetical protein